MTTTHEKTIDALVELVNKGVISGIDVLNTMFSSEIRPDTPNIKIVDASDFDRKPEESEGSPFAIVEMGFKGGLKGTSGLVFPKENASKFVEKFAGDDSDIGEFDFVSEGVLTEIGNIVLNRVMGVISNALSLNLDYIVPSYFQGELEKLWTSPSNNTGLVATTKFVVDNFDGEGNIIIFFDAPSLGALMSIMEEQGI